MKPLILTKQAIKQFTDAALLSEEETIILQTRAQGWSRSRQAEYLCISIATLDRRIAALKAKFLIVTNETENRKD